MMLRKLEAAVTCLTEILRRRPFPLFVVLMASVLAELSSPGVALALPNGTYQGNAFATNSNIKVGLIGVALGNTAFIPCPCTGTNGDTLSSSVNSLTAGVGGNILNGATAISTVHTAETTTAKIVRNSSTIQALNLLNGLITADALMAVANTTATDSAVISDADGSTFANLKIAGVPVAVNVAPNTTVRLPGIGNVTLKKTVTVGNGTTASSIVVEMISINVTLANSFGLPVGAQIVVGHAASGFFHTTTSVVVAGTSWVTYVNAAAGSLLQTSIGLTAPSGIGCQGTGGKILTNSVTALNVAGVLSLGTGNTTAIGGPTATGATAKTTATLQNLNLLNGLIRVAAITAVAETKIVNGVRTRSTNGTAFTGLKVLGINLPINVKPNTKIALPLLGYVILNEQIIPPATSNAPTRVNGLHIRITTANSLKLPVGTELILAHADSSAYNF